MGLFMSTQQGRGLPLFPLWTMSLSTREYGFSPIPQVLVTGGVQVTDLACGKTPLFFTWESVSSKEAVEDMVCGVH